MPLYTWYCPHCTGLVDVLRSFSDSDVPPTDDEAYRDGKESVPGRSVEHCGDHAWEKRIVSAPSVTRGPGWGGGKGAW